MLLPRPPYVAPIALRQQHRNNVNLGTSTTQQYPNNNNVLKIVQTCRPPQEIQLVSVGQLTNAVV